MWHTQIYSSDLHWVSAEVKQALACLICWAFWCSYKQVLYSTVFRSEHVQFCSKLQCKFTQLHLFFSQTYDKWVFYWKLGKLTGSLRVPSPGKGGSLGMGSATPPRKNCSCYRNVRESKSINSCSGTGRQPTETAYDTPSRIFSQAGQLLPSEHGIFGPCSRLGRQRKFPQRWDDTTLQFSAKQDGCSLVKFVWAQEKLFCIPVMRR